MVFCVLETIGKKELFVCPACWFEGEKDNGIVHYPPNTKEFLKYQGLQDKKPDNSWSSEPARLLAQYSEYQLAVQGMHRLEEGATSEEGRWDEKQFRKINALRNISNIPMVQDIIDNCKNTMEIPANLTVPSKSVSNSHLENTSPIHTLEPDNNNEVVLKVQFCDTEDQTETQNNIVIEMPEITCRLDKIENDIGGVILLISNIDKKINKLIEAVANIGTIMVQQTNQGTSQPIEPIGNTSSFSSLLPISNQFAFGEFETMLRNKENYQKFVAEMATYGGTSGDRKGDKIAYGLVDQLFTRQFMTECSWTGSSKNRASKNSFSTATTFLDAFFDIIKLADSRYSKSDANDFFKETILRNATSRLLNMQQKDEPIIKRRRTVKVPLPFADTSANVIENTNIETSDNIIL